MYYQLCYYDKLINSLDLIKELIQPKRLNQMEVASNPATNAALLGALFKLGCERPNPLISAVHLILVRDKEVLTEDIPNYHIFSNI